MVPYNNGGNCSHKQQEQYEPFRRLPSKEGYTAEGPSVHPGRAQLDYNFYTAAV